jgi:hypothetical protein
MKKIDEIIPNAYMMIQLLVNNTNELIEVFSNLEERLSKLEESKQPQVVPIVKYGSRKIGKTS